MSLSEIKYFIKFICKEPFQDAFSAWDAIKRPQNHVYMSFGLFTVGFFYVIYWLMWTATGYFFAVAIWQRWISGEWKAQMREEYKEKAKEYQNQG